MPQPNTLPRPLATYYASLKEYAGFGASNEGATRNAFHKLLEEWAKPHGLSVLTEQTMRGKNDRSLTLVGIPPEVHQYRLGNRSALHWVVDQYRVSIDARTGIKSDPNDPSEPQAIVRLIGQVVRVSVDSVKIVDSLPGLGQEEVGIVERGDLQERET